MAAHDLGMGVTYLDPTGSQIGKKESIADTARVLCTMFEGIEYRGFGQEIVEDLAKYSSVRYGTDLLTNTIQHRCSQICLQSRKSLAD